MKTILFLFPGSYFPAHQKIERARYELLSDHFSGYILSFVSREQWRHVQIGNFELIGFYISRSLYRFLPLRIVMRVLFMCFTTIYLHFFRKRIDAIIAYDPFMTGLLGYFLCQITGAKLIVEVNGVYDNRVNWNAGPFHLINCLKLAYVYIITPFVLNRAHCVKLLYWSQVKAFRRLRYQNRYVCYHAFVPTSLFHAGSDDSKYILFAGYPWHIKGVDVLLKAFNKICREFPDYSLKLVGYLPEKDQYKELFDHNAQIQFTGPVFSDDVIKFMSECSLFVLPSRSEAMGRVLLEAMASRKPIIASRVGGIPSYVQDGVNGLLFDTEDVDGLAELMRKVLCDKVLANKLAENGYRYVQKYLSAECYLRHFIDLVSPAGNEVSPQTDQQKS